MRIALAISIALATLGTASCAGRSTSRSDALQPSDFVAAAPVAATAQRPASAIAAAPEPSPATPDALSSGRAPGAGQGATAVPAATPAAAMPMPAQLTLQGMVGQVNGRPIYASEVFAPAHEQLVRLGAELPLAEFERQVRALIRLKLQESIINTLTLGEAERDLSKNEQMQLQGLLQIKREELLAAHGMGAPGRADAVLRATTGLGLEETLSNERQALLIKRYLHRKLYPHVNVTRRDIERWYQENYRTYNPLPGRTIRLIRAAGDDAAATIEQQLARGADFAAVAMDPKLNSHRPEEGGLWPEKVQGDAPFAQEELNSAMLKLDAGQHSPRITTAGSDWFVFVEAIDTGKGKTITEVQQEIEDALQRQQFAILTRQYGDELLRTGSYNPIDEMVDDLVAIAINRYARGA